MASDDIRINLSPYLGCSKKLVEFFAIIGYDEEEIKRCGTNILKNQNQLELAFVSIVISDFSFDIADDYIIKQVYPDKPEIIKSGIPPNQDSIIFSTCIDSENGEKKVYNSCFALRFYEKLETKKGEIYFIPKAFLIYSQYPYFSSFYRICEKILISTDERYADKDFPIEIFIHCFVNYFPSPINNNLVLKDFSPNIVIPKLTGYPYADFNLGKILNTISLIDFIKTYILIFLELDLLIFSPNLEKLNIFMFALYILNYPLTDSNYFWHIKTISIEDIKRGEGDDTVSTSFKGVNCQLNDNLDLSDFSALNFVIDLENKKQTIVSISESNEARETKNLLKYINNILNRSMFLKKSLFLEEYLLKLHKNLKNILKEYNEIASNDSNVAESFFYINKSVMNINRQIQEAFYDFVLNILVELNKDYSFDPSLKNPVVRNIVENPKLSEEEKTFLKYSRDTIKYNTYFNNFINDFKCYDGLRVSLLFSDEYVNLKKQESYKTIEDKVKYFEIMDKLYILKKTDLIYNLKALDTEYSKKNYIPSKGGKKAKKEVKLFTLNREIISKFIYKKKNKAYYEILTDPDEIKIDNEKKDSLLLTIQSYFGAKGLLKDEYYIRSSALFIISICFPFFAKDKINFVLEEYLKTAKKINYFQRYFIFIILKAINKYYQLNKEKGTFSEMEFNQVQKYYETIQNFLKENSIIQNEEIFLFFKNHFKSKEEDNKENINNEEDFCYEYNNIEFNVNILKHLKISENEMILNTGNESIKLKKMKKEDIHKLFKTLYKYYENFLSDKVDIKNLEVNETYENVINLILFFKLYKDEGDMIKILCYIINSLINFQNQLSNYKKNNA